MGKEEINTNHLDKIINELKVLQHSESLSEYGLSKLNEFENLKKLQAENEELKNRVEETEERVKNEIREWLINEDFEGLAERL